MRVLQVYKDVHPFVRGGIERYVHDLSAFLTERGHRVTVLVAGKKGRETEVSGFRVIEYPCICRILSNPVSPGLGAVLGSMEADVVHFHVPLPSAVMAWLMSGNTCPYMVTYHSDIVRQAFLMPVYGPFLRRFLEGARKVLATSPVYRETSPYLAGLQNTCVVPIGTDLRVFTPSTDGGGEYALFVGRFRSYKGIHVLLDAWREFPERRLIMVGGGPLEGLVRKRVHMDGLNVSILSDPDDRSLVELYRRASFLVLPSTRRSEAFGMVQTEAMACGVPVISTDLPTGVPWVNRHGVSGLVVPPGDPGALADAVRRMDDAGLRSRLALGALDRARNEFDSGKLFLRVEDLLREASGDGKD
ncbi:MAG: glycosyltransferase [Candidatus Fermentibacteraceae bacterium]|nr:glycosyltransferase [Candidatus Fermentibacteraceae bacterium]MBN2607642.1 glycosyltransferase [Candidatus Fermentibacteraceae bacterium]